MRWQYQNQENYSIGLVHSTMCQWLVCFTGIGHHLLQWFRLFDALHDLTFNEIPSYLQIQSDKTNHQFNGNGAIDVCPCLLH